MATVSEEVLLEVQVNDQEALANIASLTESNRGLKNELANLKEQLKENQISQEQFDKSSAQLNAQIKENTAGIRENAKEVKVHSASVASADGSINQMRSRVADLSRAYNSLSKEAREGDVGKQIAAEMGSLNTSINEANKSVGNFKDNVGNYPKLMGGVSLSNTKAGQAFESLGLTASSSAKEMAIAVRGAVKSVLLSLKALLANPVILFISLIVAAVLTLVSVFKDFQPLIDKIEQGLAALGAVFDSLKSTIMAVVLGSKSLNEAIKTGGEEMSKAAKFAIELKKAQQDLDDQILISAVNQGKYNNQIDEYILKSKNRTISDQDRIALIQKALDVEKQAFEEKKRINDTEIRIAEGNIIKGNNLTEQEIANLRKLGVEYAIKLQDTNAITDAQVKGLSDALAKQQQIINESIKIREKAQARQDQLQDDATAEREKKEKDAESAREKRQSEIDKKREKEIKSLETLLKTNQLRRSEITEKALEEDYQIELKIAKKKFRAIEEYNLAVLLLNKNLADAKLKIQQDEANEAIRRLELSLNIEREKQAEYFAGIVLSNREVNRSRLDDIDRTFESENEKLKIQRESQLISEAEYFDQLRLLQAEKRAAIAQENAEFDAIEQENNRNIQAENFANELESLRENLEAQGDVRKKQLDAQRDEEISIAKKTGADILLIEKKFAAAKKEIDRITFESKLDTASRIATGLTEIFGKETIAGKAAASAIVAIDTYKNAAKTAGQASVYFSNPLTIGLGIAAAAETAVIVGSGVKAISDIWKVSEDGEKSMSAQGTKSPASPPPMNNLYDSQASQTESALIIQQASPAPVVRVTEITEMQNAVKVKELSKI